MLPRNQRLFALLLLASLAGVFSGVVPSVAADVSVSLPVVTAPPGATVLVPISTTPGPDGLGVLSVEFRIDFPPGALSASVSQPDGWVQSWGPAYVNATDAFIAVSAAGFPATTATGTILNTLALTVSPSATPGTDVPLTFTRILLNEGTPTVGVTPGVLQVRTTAAVGPAPGGRFAMTAPSPNPATRALRFSLAVPVGGALPVRVGVYALDGRLVRDLSPGPLDPGTHDLRWDTCDGTGRPVPAGLYFACAARGGERLVRRVAVVR